MKSSNKQYDLKSLSNTNDGKNLNASAILSAIGRNIASPVAGTFVTHQRQTSDNLKLDLVGYGKLLLFNGNKVRAGNCYEMSIMAGTFIKNDGKHNENIWISSIGGRGDHAFCVYGNGKPAWKNSDEMGSDKTTLHWVIDPWANTACRPTEYPFNFRQKLRSWSEKGKRIYFKGDWVDPATAYYKGGFNEGIITHEPMA